MEESPTSPDRCSSIPRRRPGISGYGENHPSSTGPLHLKSAVLSKAQLLTVAEVAQLLGLGRQDVVLLFEGGVLRCGRYQNGYPRFKLEDVQRLATETDSWTDNLRRYSAEFTALSQSKDNDKLRYLRMVEEIGRRNRGTRQVKVQQTRTPKDNDAGAGQGKER